MSPFVYDIYLEKKIFTLTSMADLLDYFERNIPKLHISPKLETF